MARIFHRLSLKFPGNYYEDVSCQATALNSHPSKYIIQRKSYYIRSHTDLILDTLVK